MADYRYLVECGTDNEVPCNGCTRTAAGSHYRGNIIVVVLMGKLKQGDCLPVIQCVQSATVWCEQAIKLHQILCQMAVVTGDYQLTYSKNRYYTNSIVISSLTPE